MYLNVILLTYFKMRVILLSALVIIVIIILLQSFTLMSAIKAEEQKYTLVHAEKEFEIRFYPSAIIATIHSNAKTYRELSGPGFRKLAAYIFGGNKSATKISMTAPVHMDINDTVSTMSFVMPLAYNESNLPEPNDPGVIIKKTTDEYVAAIRFGGYASQKDLKFYAEKLQYLLKEKGIKAYGHYRFLGYNPPYQFINRKNEIIVTVDWKKSNYHPGPVSIHK